ncbi:hypothetical protein JIG36_45535 [Actinoplanes sp. LDG1-06]|uniref:Adenylate kinase n=1 Tax=Paractinoplanes ovalisporus TaxID=2810368 RepID=A0ABS2ASC8_9ACTN|nr:hypothetical protein [Actinoplanes ovalisporus]MBM2622787.1 hypothetical protein [Actinoplanes ovalisporus]
MAAAVARVLILGGPGSGKTTLARTVAADLRLPHTELDRIAYDPPADRDEAPFWQWTRSPDASRWERASALAATGRWVTDGLYAGWTTPLRDAADVIIWLDLPATTSLWRVLKRAVRHRWQGGSDWDLRSVRRVARGARDFRRRPAATTDQLRDRDGANGTRTLEAFLDGAGDRVIRCRSAREVRRVTDEFGPPAESPPGQ